MADVNGTESASQSLSQTQSQSQAPAPPSAAKNTTIPASSLAPTDTYGPTTSLEDNGLSARPRDARTIHMVLASLGVSAYQERVPLQLLDLAYRYTSSILADAQHLAAEGYINTSSSTTGATGATGGGKKGGGGGSGESEISLAALRLAIASRNAYQFTSNALPKENLLEMAAERNRVRLPEVDKEVCFGVRLPHERYVQTGTGWGLMEEWDSEVEEEEAEEKAAGEEAGTVEEGTAVDNKEEEEKEDEDMEDQDGFDEVFGNGGENGAMEED